LAPAVDTNQYLPAARRKLQQPSCTSLLHTGCRSTGQTDGRTDGLTPYRYKTLFSASEVTTLWRYTNMLVIIIINIINATREQHQQI